MARYDRRDHRVVHRRARVDEDPAAPAALADRAVEPAERARRRGQQRRALMPGLDGAGDRAGAAAAAALARAAARRYQRLEDVARRRRQREQVIERPVVGDRREEARRRTSRPATRPSPPSGASSSVGVVVGRAARRLGRGAGVRAAAATAQQAPRLEHGEEGAHDQEEEGGEAEDAELGRDLQPHVVRSRATPRRAPAGSSP